MPDGHRGPRPARLARGDGRGARAAPHRPRERDDPAGLETRLADLRGRIAEAAGTPPGGWETVSAEQAAHQLTGRGADLASARSLVTDYLRDTAQRVGVPVDDVAGWGLDQGDIDAIARDASGSDAARAGTRRRTRRRSRRFGGVVAVTPPGSGPSVPPAPSGPGRDGPGRDGPGRDGATVDQAGAGAVAGLAREVDALRRTIEPLVGSAGPGR